MPKIDENFKLDLKDRKILYELDLNSRESCSKIGKKVGLSSEVVNYRIKKLDEEKIITHYQTIVNFSKLNIIQFKICLSFQHLKSEKLKEIIEVLKKNKSVKWIASCNGNWDMLITLETDSFEKIDVLKSEVLALFSGYINQKAISILVEASTHNRDYLLDRNLRSERIIMNKDKVVKLDETDLEILKYLAENSRKQIIDIAISLGISERIVNYKIKQLVKNKVITGFKIAINYEKLGIKFFKTFIYLDNPSELKIKEIVNYLKKYPNVIHYVKVLGNWELEPEFEVYTEERFNEILNEIKDRFSDVIKKVDIITIEKEHKFVYF